MSSEVSKSELPSQFPLASRSLWTVFVAILLFVMTGPFGIGLVFFAEFVMELAAKENIEGRWLMRMRVTAGTFLVVAAVWLIETGGQIGGGTWFAPFVIVFLAAPVLVPWLAKSLFVIWRQPELRRLQWIKIGSGLFALGIGIGTSATVVGYSMMSERAEADRIIALVEAYKAQHGHYPKTLDGAGANLGQEAERWGILYSGKLQFLAPPNGYSNDFPDFKHLPGVDPELSYPGPVFNSMYEYRFETGRWEYSEED